MTKFLFIRHGEPDYSSSGNHRFSNRDFAPLTEKGRNQVKVSSQDHTLENAELIICSPYIMAYESAKILSKELNIKLVIEKNLYEWLPDKQLLVRDCRDFISLLRDFSRNKGIYPPGEDRRWEDRESIKERTSGILRKYEAYKTVIVVSHAIVISVVTGKERIGYGEIIEKQAPVKSEFVYNDVLNI